MIRPGKPTCWTSYQEKVAFMKKNNWAFIALLLAALLVLSCQAITGLPDSTVTPQPSYTPTALPPIPVIPGEENPDEPVFITGDIPYTSPFFLDSISEPFVLLEDQAGFVQRDEEFKFNLASQAIGPVELLGDGTVTYSLALPSIPQGTMLDVDNNDSQDEGVQVFAIAYWSNTWGGPFLEERDGTGWSTAYASTITDPENDNEIKAGLLVVWAPNDDQSFPDGFGTDGLLFTADDPVVPIPAGYNLVDINQEPFVIYKEARPYIVLNEGEIAVNDFTQLSYGEAFEALFAKVSREYPFTEEKHIDWEALHQEFSPRMEAARNDAEFYKAVRDFTWQIPDSHVGMTLNAEVFIEEHGGGFGLILTELGDGRVLATQVFPAGPASQAGIQVEAEILTWNGVPISEAIAAVTPYFGPYSTEQQKRLEQVVFLTRVPVDTRLEVQFRNPGENEKEVTLQAAREFDSLFLALPNQITDELLPPVQGEVLDDSGIGYIRVNSFSDDYSLTARLWEHYIERMVDNEVAGLILDMRINGGGSSHLAHNFAGYFFENEFDLYQTQYYNENKGIFTDDGTPDRIEPAPLYFDGPIVVLVSPYCFSACEGFTYALTRENRATIIGQYPTAGAYGEVGRGQYELPGDIQMQFPTGRSITPEGELLLEGVGVIPQIVVPVTEETALGEQDAVLETAIQTLLDEIR